MSVAQSWTAYLYGYENWHALAKSAEKLVGPPSPDDEDVDLPTRNSRFIFQALRLQEIAGFTSVECGELVLRLGPTAKGGPKATYSEQPNDEDLLFPRAMQASIEQVLAEVQQIFREAPGIKEHVAKQTGNSLADISPDPAAEPLFLAIQRKNAAQALAWLETHPGHVHAVSESGGTALIACAMVGLDEVVQKLLTLGADPNLADLEGFTPLHEAARRGRVVAVKALLHSKANPNTVTPTTWSPLHMALNTRIPPATPSDYNAVVAQLLAAGADVSYENIAGWSAVTVAESIPDLAPALVQRIRDIAQQR